MTEQDPGDDVQTTGTELEKIVSRLHEDNENLRDRLKELLQIMESSMDDLVESEVERDDLQRRLDVLLSHPLAWMKHPFGAASARWNQRRA